MGFKKFAWLAVILIIIPIVIAAHYTKICPDCDYYTSCQSNSMYPTFDCNDILFARPPINRADIKIGNIIWFTMPVEEQKQYTDGTKWKVHRIIGMNYTGCYITKGDNNAYQDSFQPCFYDIKFKIVGVMYE